VLSQQKHIMHFFVNAYLCIADHCIKSDRETMPKLLSHSYFHHCPTSYHTFLLARPTSTLDLSQHFILPSPTMCSVIPRRFGHYHREGSDGWRPLVRPDRPVRVVGQRRRGNGYGCVHVHHHGRQGRKGPGGGDDSNRYDPRDRPHLFLIHRGDIKANVQVRYQ